jgi:flagellar basal-body rod modification protein FlgD
VTIDQTTQAAGGIDPTASPTRTVTNALGRDAFLSLLVTQLQHQDPLEPQANGEFIAQLAQFSSLENLEQISQDIAALRSAIEGQSAA